MKLRVYSTNTELILSLFNQWWIVRKMLGGKWVKVRDAWVGLSEGFSRGEIVFKPENCLHVNATHWKGGGELEFMECIDCGQKFPPWR